MGSSLRAFDREFCAKRNLSNVEKYCGTASQPSRYPGASRTRRVRRVRRVKKSGEYGRMSAGTFVLVRVERGTCMHSAHHKLRAGVCLPAFFLLLLPLWARTTPPFRQKEARRRVEQVFESPSKNVRRGNLIDHRPLQVPVDS